MILLSELSRRRIRSINKLIRVGRNEVVVVIRVDKEKGYIDLSKRRVSSEEILKLCGLNKPYQHTGSSGYNDIYVSTQSRIVPFRDVLRTYKVRIRFTSNVYISIVNEDNIPKMSARRPVTLLL